MAIPAQPDRTDEDSHFARASEHGGRVQRHCSAFGWNGWQYHAIGADTGLHQKAELFHVVADLQRSWSAWSTGKGQIDTSHTTWIGQHHTASPVGPAVGCAAIGKVFELIQPCLG